MTGRGRRGVQAVSSFVGSSVIAPYSESVPGRDRNRGVDQRRLEQSRLTPAHARFGSLQLHGWRGSRGSATPNVRSSALARHIPSTASLCPLTPDTEISRAVQAIQPCQTMMLRPRGDGWVWKHQLPLISDHRYVSPFTRALTTSSPPAERVTRRALTSGTALRAGCSTVSASHLLCGVALQIGSVGSLTPQSVATFPSIVQSYQSSKICTFRSRNSSASCEFWLRG